MKRPSDWLRELGTHSILETQGAIEDYANETGKELSGWQSYSWDEVKAIMDERGLGGTMPSDKDARYMFAWELAEAVAMQMVPGFEPKAMGRGTRCWDAIQALEAHDF